MSWYKRFSSSMLSALELAGRARALSVLRSMDPRLLSEAGISPELIQRGIEAWPWRAEAIDPTKLSGVQTASREVVANTGQTVGGSPAPCGLGRVNAPDAPVIPERIENDVAA